MASTPSATSPPPFSETDSTGAFNKFKDSVPVNPSSMTKNQGDVSLRRRVFSESSESDYRAETLKSLSSSPSVSGSSVEQYIRKSQMEKFSRQTTVTSAHHSRVNSNSSGSSSTPKRNNSLRADSESDGLSTSSSPLPPPLLARNRKKINLTSLKIDPSEMKTPTGTSNSLTNLLNNSPLSPLRNYISSQSITGTPPQPRKWSSPLNSPRTTHSSRISSFAKMNDGEMSKSISSLPASETSKKSTSNSNISGSFSIPGFGEQFIAYDNFSDENFDVKKNLIQQLEKFKENADISIGYMFQEGNLGKYRNMRDPVEIPKPIQLKLPSYYGKHKKSYSTLENIFEMDKRDDNISKQGTGSRSADSSPIKPRIPESPTKTPLLHSKSWPPSIFGKV